MPIIVPNSSETFILGLILGKQPTPTGQLLRLFKNSHNPSENTTLSDIQEADQLGYSPILLGPGDWIIEQLNGTTTAHCSEKEFNFFQSATIYGYYVTTVGDNPLLMWIERFSSGSSSQYFDIPSPGGVLKIVPKISLN